MIETATTPAQAEDARPYPRVACHGASTIQIGTLTLSGEFDEIVAGLGAVQAAINENRLVAESRNEVLGNPYASLPAILRALTPHLKAAGITLLQPWESHGDIVRVTTVFLKGRQFAAMSASIRADNSLPQAIGSATTYCCRYSVRAMLGLAVDGPDDQDDDGNLASGVTARGASSKPRADATSDRKGEQSTGYSEKLRGYLKRVATADLAGLTSAEAQVPAFGLAEEEEKALLDAIRERKQAFGADGSGVAEGAGSPTPKAAAQADTTKTAAAGTQKGQAKQSSEPSAKLRGYLKRVATADLAGLTSAEAQVPAFGLAETEEKVLLDAIRERKQALGANGGGVAEDAGSPTPKAAAQADTTKTPAAGTQKGQVKQPSEPSAKLRGYLKRVATADLAGLTSAEAQVPAFGLAKEEEEALRAAILERKQTLAGPASDSV